MAPWTATEFEVFVNESAGRMLAVIRHIMRNDSDAEDALQDTLLAAWRSRDSFDGRSSMSTWVHRIATNTAINKFRQVSARSSRIESDLEGVEHPVGGGPSQKLELQEIVWKAIDLLPPDQRIVLVLRDVEQMSSDEVAEKLNLAPAAVRQRLHRARKHVAELLKPELCGALEMTCGGRLDLLMDMIDGMLAEDMREPVSAHVAGCKTCRGYAAGYGQTIKLAGETAEETAAVSPGLLNRMLQAIRR